MNETKRILPLPAPGDPVWIHHNSRTFEGYVKEYGPGSYDVTVTTVAGAELIVHKFNINKREDSIA